MTKKEKKVDAPVDLEVSASKEQAVIAQEGTTTHNADNSSAVDSEAEANPSAEPQTDTLLNNNKQINNTMEQVNNSTANGNNEQVNEQLEEAAQVNNPEVESSSTSIDSLLNLLDRTKVKQKFFISYREASKAGIKLAFVKGNRKVYSAQIDKLWNEIKDKEQKKFSRSSVVISAKAILDKNEALPSEKRIHIVDLNGKELTLTSPAIEEYVVVIDGQHRSMVCIEHPEADMELELTELEGDIMELIRILNSTDKNWGVKDLSFSNIALGKVSGDLQTKIDELKGILKVSDRAAAYLLTFKRDSIRKRDVAAGQDNSGYTESNGERGMSIAKAIRYKFDSEDVVCKLEFIDSVTDIYNTTSDDKKAGFTKKMVCFLADMKDEVKMAIINEMKSGNFGKVKEMLKEAHKAYLEEHPSDMDTRFNELQPQIEAAMPKADTTTVEALKEGLPHIILKNRAEVRHQNASDALEKAEKAVKDAQEAYDNADKSNKKKSTETSKTRLSKKKNALEEKKQALQIAQKNLDEAKAALDSFNQAA